MSGAGGQLVAIGDYGSSGSPPALDSWAQSGGAGLWVYRATPDASGATTTFFYPDSYDQSGMRCGIQPGQLPTINGLQVLPGAAIIDSTHWIWFGWDPSTGTRRALTAPTLASLASGNWAALPYLKSLDLDPNGYWYGSGGRESGPQGQTAQYVWRWDGNAASPIEGLTDSGGRSQYWYFGTPGASPNQAWSNFPNGPLASEWDNVYSGSDAGYFQNIGFGPFIFRHAGYWWGWNGRGHYKYNLDAGSNTSWFDCTTLVRFDASDVAPDDAAALEGPSSLRLALCRMLTPPPLGGGRQGAWYQSAMQQAMMPLKWHGCVILPDGSSTSMYMNGTTLLPGDPYYSGDTAGLVYGDDGRSLWILGPDGSVHPMFTMTWDSSRDVGSGGHFENSAQGNNVVVDPDTGALYYTYFTGYAMGSFNTQGTVILHVVRLDSYDLSTWSFTWSEVAALTLPLGSDNFNNDCTARIADGVMYLNGLTWPGGSSGNKIYALNVGTGTWLTPYEILDSGGSPYDPGTLLIVAISALTRRRSYVVQI